MNTHTFILDNDLQVSLEKLVQEYTYGGLLEGHPGEQVNRMVLHNIQRRAKNDLGLEEIYTLVPIATNEELPEVVCMALFHSSSTFKDPEMDGSNLGVIWFQNDFAFPIEQEILEQFKTVPFRELCLESEY